MSAHAKLVLALLSLATVVLVGSVGYLAIDGNISFSQAAYMTVITISTVGFGEQWELSEGARLWTIFIILVGVMVATVAFASLQAMIVGGELRAVLGRKKLKDQIGKLREHYIICGYGRMGRLIARDLQAINKVVVVIDIDEKRTTAADDAGLPYVLGDAASDKALADARLDHALGLVACLRTDADNVYVTLTARGLNSEVPIIARAENLETQAKLIRAGATQVICPHAIGAFRAVNLLARPAIASFVDIARGNEEWEIEEVAVQTGSPIADRSLRDLDLRAKARAMIVAIRTAEGKTNINPGPDTVVKPGDVLVVIGPAGETHSLAE